MTIKLPNDEVCNIIMTYFNTNPNSILSTGSIAKACYPTPTPIQKAQVCSMLANLRLSKVIKRVRRGHYQLINKEAV